MLCPGTLLSSPSLTLRQLAERIQRFPLEADLEVEHGLPARSEAHRRDSLAGAHVLALLYLHDGIVAVGGQPAAHVVEDHELSVAEQPAACVDDLAVGGREDRLVEPAVDAQADAAGRLAHDADDLAGVDRPAPGGRPMRGVVGRCARRPGVRRRGLPGCDGGVSRRPAEPKPLADVDQVVGPDAVPACDVAVVEPVAPGYRIERLARADHVVVGRIGPSVRAGAGGDRKRRGTCDPCFQVTPPSRGTKLTNPSRSRMNWSPRRVRRRSSWRPSGPTGATRRPPSASWSRSFCGSAWGAAASRMPSKGACDCQPSFPSPCLKRTFLMSSSRSRSFARSRSGSIRSML